MLMPPAQWAVQRDGRSNCCASPKSAAEFLKSTQVTVASGAMSPRGISVTDGLEAVSVRRVFFAATRRGWDELLRLAAS